LGRPPDSAPLGRLALQVVLRGMRPLAGRAGSREIRAREIRAAERRG